ncbi:DUF3039 domain-containing protein [Candidatus Aquiluna sp. UB-MaderosW2red]|jgi:hypothetical protein|uniref:DUF3039 domain-containing protein n=1 Tax=Candidatus Aquiluna sp. UB-MaderosW2red TaxID=1855377 RepID=UPI000875D51C|nr:DUF3039 domain-containing protein [Candidatus Aquiluna sp. UB-MaderosW2red]SCX13970.1 Protein of unknown function [Candidatus Aquiluna sp. UB-MaderosW2red]
MSDSKSSGSTLEKEQVSTDSGDHEKYSHYVKKNKIVESAVMGNAVVALCGKVWVPAGDPVKYPVCPDCKAIYEGLKPGKEDKD